MNDLFHGTTIWGILIRFFLNLIFLFILIRLLYFRYTKKEKFLFTFFLIGISVFFICTMLKDMNMELGVGIGLFAIFSILRFRTRNFSVKDMSYIFTTIAVSVINSVNLITIPMIGFIVINLVIVGSAFVLEEYLKRNSFCKYSVSYDNIDLLKPGSNHKLIKDLSARTGLDIIRVKIRNINLKRAVAQLDIYFQE